MSVLSAAAARPLPELNVLSPGQYNLILYSVVVAGFGLLASFLYSWTSRNEVSARYRPAVLASICITGVAFVSYIVIFSKVDSGYTFTNGSYQPNNEARLTIAPRYMDWSVTVPLLTAELLAVCSLAGARARSLRFTTMAAAFLMIITGYIGAHVVDEGTSTAALWIWGIISTVFYVYLYVALWGAVRSSLGSMGTEAGTTLRNAAILLLSVFGVYPLVYAIRVFFEGAEWTTTMHVAYSFADLTAKAGFGALIHKVAKLRTAEDVAKGEETHPEPVWISNERKSEGVQPTIKSLAEWPRIEHIDLAGIERASSARTVTAGAAATGPATGATSVTTDVPGATAAGGRASGRGRSDGRV